MDINLAMKKPCVHHPGLVWRVWHLVYTSLLQKTTCFLFSSPLTFSIVHFHIADVVLATWSCLPWAVLGAESCLSPGGLVADGFWHPGRRDKVSHFYFRLTEAKLNVSLFACNHFSQLDLAVTIALIEINSFWSTTYIENTLRKAQRHDMHIHVIIMRSAWWLHECKTYPQRRGYKFMMGVFRGRGFGMLVKRTVERHAYSCSHHAEYKK